MRTLLTLTLLALILTSCGRGQRGMNDLSPEEQAELNHYLGKRDECLVQESARLDDNSSDINALTDLVMYKCGPVFREISSLIYDKFQVDLSSSYAFKMQTEEGSKKQVTEAILTNRKMRAGMNPGAALLRQAPVIMPPTRAQPQPMLHNVVPEGTMPIPAPRQVMPQQQRQIPPQRQRPAPAPAPAQVQGW